MTKKIVREVENNTKPDFKKRKEMAAKIIRGV